MMTLESPVGAEVILDGRPYVNFAGSSYLGLAGHPQILAAGVTALQQYGSGAHLAREQHLVTAAHAAAEQEGSRFFRSPAAVFLGSGYHFGLIAVAALRDDFGVVFCDERAHFCLRDAIAASGIKSFTYRHADSHDLAQRLKECLEPSQRPIIATDGLFSTFGGIAPLFELSQAASQYGGRLLVDESHSFGVLGPTGRGACEHHGINPADALMGGSLAKAFGVCGGIVPANNKDVALMRATSVARGATAGMAAAAAMAAQSLRYADDHPELLENLRSNVRYLKARLNKIGLEVGDSVAPVATFVPPDKDLRHIKQALFDKGILVYHTNYIGAGVDGVIRCGIFADHTIDHIDRLVDSLAQM